MESHHKRRAFKRYRFQAPVKIYTSQINGNRNQEVDLFQSGWLGNYSRRGVYLETGAPIQEGTAITLNVFDPDNEGSEGSTVDYKASVIWCRKISDTPNRSFGIGLAYDTVLSGSVFGF